MAEKHSSQPAHYAVLIGINAYSQKPLKGCVRDVQHIKSLLEQQQFPIEIQAFTATSNSHSGIVEDPNHWPTYKNVTKALRVLTARAQPGDCVYIHYSGHGTRWNPGGEFSNQHTGDLALALLNGENGESVRELGGHRLAMALNAMVIKELVVTLVLDCCFAASVYRHDSSNVRFIPIDPNLASAYAIDNDITVQDVEALGSGFRDASMLPSWLINPNGYALLAACGPHEEATEIVRDEIDHGALSRFLYLSLRDGGLKKRHKDIFYHLISKFRGNELEQSPILYGNKDQPFFGHSKLSSPRPMIPVVRRGNGFILQAGHAHAVSDGDEFMLYPSIVFKENAALHTDVVSAKTDTTGPLTSLLHLEDGMTSTPRIEWVAEPRTRHALRGFPISLGENLPRRDEWVTVFDKRFISVQSRTDSCLPLFHVALLGDEYKILDKNDQEVMNIPTLSQDNTSLEHIVAILEHLIRYELVKELTNHSVSDDFRASFEISIINRAGDSFSPDRDINVEQDTSNKYMFELCLRNKGTENLYLYVYDLGPFWQIEEIHCGTYAVIPPLNHSEPFTGQFGKKLRTLVPKEMRERGIHHCDDILKVLVTSHPTSFDILELPNMGEFPRKQSLGEPDRTGNNGPEKWAAFSFRNLDYLEESITLLKEVINSTSPGDVRRPMWLIDLAFTLNLRYNATGSEDHAIESSRVAFESVNEVQKDDPAYFAILGCACDFITQKAIRVHNEDDLEKVIEMHKSILAMTPCDHPQYISRLRDYDRTLFKGYRAFGHREALEESIRVSQYIVGDPEEDPDEHAGNLFVLGKRLIQRYLLTGTSADLIESIKACQEAVNQTPVTSEDRHRRLQSLCNGLGTKYSQTLDEVDFQATKRVMDEILDNLPTEPKSRARSLGNAGIILSLRYRQTGCNDSLQKAVEIGQESVALAPVGDMASFVRLSNLSTTLSESYEKTRNIEQLEESIRIGKEALAAAPEGHPHKHQLHFNLADRLWLRYRQSKSANDLDEAISFYSLILEKSSTPFFIRVQAGYALMQSYLFKPEFKAGNFEDAYKAGETTVIILAELRPRSLQNADIQREAGGFSGLASEVASTSLTLGHSPVAALELLEMARGVMASSISVLRADIQDLENEFPDLANQYNRLRDQLDVSSTRKVDLEMDWGNEPSLRYNNGEAFASLLREIRSKPGFQNFLRADDEKRMRSAAALGPVVVVNVSQSLCDAIIIRQDGFVAIPLDRLEKRDIDSKYNTLGRGNLQVLEWLWDVIAEPILNALGRHTQRNGETVMDRVMSSYATSVGAIVQSRRTKPTTSTNEALLVSAADTPGHRKLHFADKEVRMLQDVMKRMKLQPVEPQPLRDEVVSHLRKCKIFHFAGHGYTDTTDPSQSQLFLKDWRTNPLTVSSLLDLNLHQHGPFMAYLSACGTGQIKTQELFDEGIHLISACQLAGFRHVIGTLWEVNDRSCVDMAAMIYQEIDKGCMSDESVCRGVHVATKAKRDQWLDETYGAQKPESSVEMRSRKTHEKLARKERDIISVDEEEDESSCAATRNGPLHWVPYVHFWCMNLPRLGFILSYPILSAT
ncbi:hypothetical protein FSARC_10198 [Fusarium sarcochroum]|uniref:CHAT domain-containing protein n=1 Tax=Fusarium sarcochroum TaxID=1208366 RepID=A0A8H4X495_9HYPO|nr:hypothetical protein FSARC_10198 [Fusarium sarcochroum]